MSKKNKHGQEKDEVVEIEEDRSVFNCPLCIGKGLEKNGVVETVCSQCNGTGKV
jgi:DnaJ-class molecular chaperone